MANGQCTYPVNEQDPNLPIMAPPMIKNGSAFSRPPRMILEFHPQNSKDVRCGSNFGEKGSQY